jgi:N-acetylmuramoyl-L-alanine amidase CwlA
MSDDRQHRIRQRAHAIWERHGRPDGADRDHWHQATQEIDAEDATAGQPARTAKPKATNSTPSIPAMAVKKTAAKRKPL